MVFLFFLHAGASSLYKIENNDICWHLKTGELIVQNRSVPRVDPYSLIDPGKKWVDHEWLFQVFAHGIYAGCGASGLVLLRSLLVLLIFFVIYRYTRKIGLDEAKTIFILCFSLVAARSRFMVRPEIVSLFLFVLLLHCLLLPPRRTVLRYLFPAFLIIVWCNVHGACLYGVLASFAIAGGELLNLFFWKTADPVQRSLSFAPPSNREIVIRIASVLARPFLILSASFLNPYTYEMYIAAFRLRRIVGLPHVPNPEWGFPYPGDFPWFYALLVLTAFVLLLGRKEIDFRALSLYVLFAGLSLMYLRNVGFFSVCAPFILCSCLINARFPVLRYAGFFPIPAALAIVCFYFAFSDAYQYGFGWRKECYPIREVEFLDKNKIKGRIFTEVKFGDYLIFKKYPPERVFIDGRNEIHEDLLKELFASLSSTESWQAFLEKYRLNIALLRYPPQLQGVLYVSGNEIVKGYRAFSAVYFPKARWALVYWDDSAMVFLKREPPVMEIIASQEYRMLNPDDSDYLLDKVKKNKLDGKEILSEIARKLQENPSCTKAKALFELFAEK